MFGYVYITQKVVFNLCSEQGYQKTHCFCITQRDAVRNVIVVQSHFVVRLPAMIFIAHIYAMTSLCD